MSNLPDSVGTAHEFEFEGVKYKATELDLVKLGKVTRWLVERAKAFAAAGVDSREAESDRAQINADAAAGLYDPGSVLFARACATRTGAAYILLLALEENHPEATLELTQKMIDADFMRSAELLLEVSPNPKGSSGKGARTKAGATLSRRFGTKRSGHSKKSVR